MIDTLLSIPPTVHTTGVNWDGILVNAGVIGVIISAVGKLIVNSVNRTIEDKLRNIVADEIDSKVTPQLQLLTATQSRHSIDIARLQGQAEGRRAAIDQAGIGPVTPNNGD